MKSVLTIIVLCLANLASASADQPETVDSLKKMELNQYSICMVETYNPESKGIIRARLFGAYDKIQRVVITCDGRKVSEMLSPHLGGYFITGSQEAAKVLIEQGFKLGGVGDNRVLIFTK